MLCLPSLLGFQVAVHIFVSTMIAVCPTTLNSPFPKLSLSTHMLHKKRASTLDKKTNHMYVEFTLGGTHDTVVVEL